MEVRDPMGGEAVYAPLGELLGAVEIIDRPGDDAGSAVMEKLNLLLGEKRVAAGDSSGLDIPLRNGEEEIELGLDVDRVKECDFGSQFIHLAEDVPELRGSGDAQIGAGFVECSSEKTGGSGTAILDIEEDVGFAGGFGEQLGQAERAPRGPAEIPLFEPEGERVDGALMTRFEAPPVNPEVDLNEVRGGGDGVLNLRCGITTGVSNEGRAIPAGDGNRQFAGPGVEHQVPTAVG
jgi:hypothetical protein